MAIPPTPCHPFRTSFVTPLRVQLTGNALARVARCGIRKGTTKDSVMVSMKDSSTNESGTKSRQARRKRLARRTASAGRTRDKWERVQPAPRHPMVSPDPTTPPRTSDLRPESCPALVLNADYSPLSYMPLSLWPWQEVVKAVFLDRVTVVATYDVGVRSPGMLFQLPSVISLKQYQPVQYKKPAFTRFNVFLRDVFSCQYCGNRFPTQDLTFDHVIPRCRGGKTNWENVVTACVSCNHSKGRKVLPELPGLKLKRPPKEPSNIELQSNARKFPPQYLHESWRDYVYWSQSMEVEEN